MKIITDKSQLKGLTNTALGMRKQKRIVYNKPTLNDQDTRENIALLEDCRRYWDSMRDFRTRRQRNKKYYRGDQWSDEVYDQETDQYITEETYIMNQGKVPLKQNQIRQLMKNLIGQYRSNPNKSIVMSRSRENAVVTEMLTNALQCALQNNMATELDARLFEEYGLSGAPIQKVGYDYFKTRNLEDVRLYNVNPSRFFCNSDVADIRLTDLRLAGEIIDTTIDEIVSAFAKNNTDEKIIRDIYTGLVSTAYLSENGLDSSRIDNLDFYLPVDFNKARLFEIWYLKGAWKVYAHDPVDGSYNIVPYTLEEIAAQNQERLRVGQEQGIPDEEIPLIEAKPKYEQAWHVKYLTPTGYCLFESETPYKHEEHPYVITLYPLLDGEVWGFIEDIIDQQRYINRLIIMMDFIMGSSAKGILMIPEDVIPDNMTVNDFAKEWTKFNGVITYKPQPHQKLPEQISSNSTNIGISELLSLQMSLIQEISGVHGAIQGKDATSGKPASLYAQEAQNATLNTLDYMATFQAFQQKRDTKVLKLITQFYKDKRYLAINGRSVNEASKLYDPDLVKNLDFDVVVTQGVDTPVYRQIIDETLMKLLEGQMIDIEMFLEQTSLPFADKLLAAIKQRKEQMVQGAGMEQLPPELVQQAAQGANPKAMEMLNRAVGNKQLAA